MNSSSRHRILIAEDEPKIARLLVDYLRSAGYVTEVVATGAAVVPLVRRSPPALILLDLMLPGRHGLDICRELRTFSDVPVVMVTALADEAARLRGLDGGADDYICKPFSPREVVARVRAVLRRRQSEPLDAGPWVAGALVLDEGAMRVTVAGQPVELTMSEYRILRRLMKVRGRVQTRAQLLAELHRDQDETADRAIDTHVKNIRKKLGRITPGAVWIGSVYGEGYRLEPGA